MDEDERIEVWDRFEKLLRNQQMPNRAAKPLGQKALVDSIVETRSYGSFGFRSCTALVLPLDFFVSTAKVHCFGNRFSVRFTFYQS